MNIQYVGHKCKHMKIMKYICSIYTLKELFLNKMDKEMCLLV